MKVLLIKLILIATLGGKMSNNFFDFSNMGYKLEFCDEQEQRDDCWTCPLPYQEDFFKQQTDLRFEYSEVKPANMLLAYEELNELIEDDFSLKNDITQMNQHLDCFYSMKELIPCDNIDEFTKNKSDIVFTENRLSCQSTAPILNEEKSQQLIAVPCIQKNLPIETHS